MHECFADPEVRDAEDRRSVSGLWMSFFME